MSGFYKLGVFRARSEGYISAPECNHAVAETVQFIGRVEAVIDVAPAVITIKSGVRPTSKVWFR